VSPLADWGRLLLSLLLHSLSLQYQELQDKTLIHPVSFSIKPRQMLAIMGA
jgi:ABC-type multidrug transport system fused ATPase/permease subunit